MTAPNVVAQERAGANSVISVTSVIGAGELDAAAARRLLSEARSALAAADYLLAQLYAGKAWRALGHKDWAALCAAELPELVTLKLRAAPRRARIQAMLDAAGGRVPVRDLAAATAAGLATVHDDLSKLTASAVTEPAPVQSKADLTVELVAGRGTRGMTVRELCRAAKWHHGQASGQLSRLNRRGRVRATGELRGGLCVYVVDPA